MPYTKEQLTLEILQAVVDEFGFDGHSLYDADAMIKRGHPSWLIDEHRRSFTSVVGEPDKSVFSSKDGSLVERCTAVHGLDLIAEVAQVLGLPGSTAMGRGFRAREISYQLQDYIDEHNEKKGDKPVDSGGPPEVKE